MGKAELMQEKITQQRKLPEEIKEKLNSITFINFLISISIMVYLLAINILYLNEELSFFITSVRVFAIILIVIDVILFEIGYRKDSIPIWIHGFELLICSILILTIPYIYVYKYDIIRVVLMLAPVFFSIYYVGKTILIHIIETKKYQNNLSDVREIIKDEEEGYLDDIEEDSDLIDDVKKIEEQKNLEKDILKQAKKARKKGDIQ